jgi:hypothetical protein
MHQYFSSTICQFLNSLLADSICALLFTELHTIALPEKTTAALVRSIAEYKEQLATQKEIYYT